MSINYNFFSRSKKYEKKSNLEEFSTVYSPSADSADKAYRTSSVNLLITGESWALLFYIYCWF